MPRTFLLDRLGGGSPVQLSHRPDEPVVVNFFASWCANCVAELGAFASVSKDAGSARFLGIDSNDASSTEARALLKRAGVGYPVGIDASGTTADRYLVAALPVTFFISRSGVIRGRSSAPRPPLNSAAGSYASRSVRNDQPRWPVRPIRLDWRNGKARCAL